MEEAGGWKEQEDRKSRRMERAGEKKDTRTRRRGRGRRMVPMKETIRVYEMGFFFV